MNRKYRICHICSYYTNELFDNLVTSQNDFVDASVFYFKKFGSPKEYNSSYVDEVNCYDERERWLFFLKAKKVYDAYRNTFQNKMFDLNFAHSLFSNGIIAYKDKVERGTPYIIAIQNTDINYFYIFKPYLKGYAYNILLNAERIVFASNTYMKELIVKHIPYGVKTQVIIDKSVVTPYGIDNLFFEHMGEPHQIGTPVRVLSVGQIRWNKNHIRLAKAIKKLRKSNNITLTIVGEYYNKWIVKQLRKYNFVTIRSKVAKEKLRELYEAADIFALTSIRETFGLVYAEALSQGLPIIYSRGQGFDGQFPEGDVGFSVDALSVDDIANGIKKVITNYNKINKNVSARSHKFEWKKIARQYHELYDEVVG